MNCHTALQYRDTHLDDRLDGETQRTIADHLHRCPDCARRFRTDEALLASLREQPVPAPSQDLVEAAMGRVAARQRRRRRAGTFGGLAAAASLLVAVTVALMGEGPGSQPTGPTVVAVEPGKTQRITLAFNSQTRREGVTLSLVLPEGVAIDGHSGKRRLSWQTTLEPGRNLLELPIIVNGSGGIMRAGLDYGSEQRTFHLQIRPKSPDESALSSEPNV